MIHSLRFVVVASEATGARMRGMIAVALVTAALCVTPGRGAAQEGGDPGACTGFRDAVVMLGAVADLHSGTPLAGVGVQIVARDEAGNMLARQSVETAADGGFCVGGLPLPAVFEVRPVRRGFVGRGVVFEWEGGADVRVELFMEPGGTARDLSRAEARPLPDTGRGW